MGVPDISRIRPFGPNSEYVNAIIEAPKGSQNKYRYDEDLGLFTFDKVLPIGHTFPFDFGFLPSTEGGDGDPLDILVLTERPTFVGCLIHAKLVGVIEAEQTQGGKTERNDRLIGIPLEVKTGKPAIMEKEQLDPKIVDSIAKFFVVYNELQGKKFKVLRHAGPERAEALVKIGMDNVLKHKKRA